jgi:thioredoxin-related protein
MTRLFSLLAFGLLPIPTGCQGQEARVDAALPVSSAAPMRSAGSVPAIEWIEFQKALALADSSSKALLVDVYASWCPWCARMQDSVYTQTPILEYIDRHFVTARLNVESVDDKIHFKGYTLSSAQLASGFGAEATPTTVFLTSTGDYITRLPGYVDAEGFLHVLRYIGSEAYKEKSFDQYMEEGD